MSDISQLQSVADGVKDFSISMYTLNASSACDSMNVSTKTKIVNNWMNKPDAINSTQG